MAEKREGNKPISLSTSNTSNDVRVRSNPSESSDATTINRSQHDGVKGVYEMLMERETKTTIGNTNNASPNVYSGQHAFHRPIPKNETSYVDPDHLPYFLPWSIQSSRRIDLPPDFTWLSNSCGGRAVIGVIGGGTMGLLMGVFLGAMSDATPPVQVIAGKEVPQAPLREQMRATMRATGAKSMYWCRNFAFISGVFGGSECLVEKYRGKHDVWNSVASGCITGAALQAKAGPQAAAVGCGGFAAFSLVIDSFMGHY
jgi:mitochondrial import inner membrane translocase subunit TIM22